MNALPNTAMCPYCGEIANALPLSRKVDKKERIVTITYECPKGHQFSKSQPIQ